MEVRKLLGSSRIKLLSKIENKAGSDNFESILKISDGIIIDRGYLGVEIDVQQVALRQKAIIRMCNLVGKPVLVANHVLETLCDHPRPTRSEASDITSVIMDGVDALVLSAETALGKYPVESLKWLSSISLQVEKSIDYHHFKMNILRFVEKPVGISESIASSAVKCAREVNASCIIVVTEAGGTARLVSKYRTSTPVIVATSDALTARQLTTSFGLIPFHHATATATSDDKNVKSDSKNDILEAAMNFAVDQGFGRVGDPVVVASGQVHGFLEGTTTVMQVVPLTAYH